MAMAILLDKPFVATQEIAKQALTRAKNEMHKET